MASVPVTRTTADGETEGWRDGCGHAAEGAGPAGAGRGGRAGVLGAGRAAPAGAARALLPDARVVRGRRGRGAGDVPARLAAAGDVRGAVDVPGLAVPDRHQRLPGPAGQVPPGGAPGAP